MDIKKLQTLVVDALEDVKAQDIVLFDTTHLTSLFDRIAIASGTSNRQTKALAASVRDKVKEAGGDVSAWKARTPVNGCWSTWAT
jgi:ribosome-associated protein